ncbi:MAG: hypothetical protein ABH864_03600 [archaeon]
MKFKIPKTFMGKPVKGAIKRALDAKPLEGGDGNENPGTQNYDFGGPASDSFILSYDGTHGTFAQELIAKSNETFKGTKAEIPGGTQGEVQGNIMKRLALVTTLYTNSQLASSGLWPINPTQSEALLRDGKLVNPENNWEDLALILYDRSQNGENPHEAQVLYNSLKQHKQALHLTQGDLEKKLVVVNAGLQIDADNNYGVSPVVLPKLTKVYTHEVLDRLGEEPVFKGYGLSGGLPLLNQLDEEGDRTLFMPDETEDIGLHVLYRSWNLSLYAGVEDLAGSYEDGRVYFAPQARAAKSGGGK